MLIILGSDHAAFYLKKEIYEYLKNKGIDVIDVGTFSNKSCDYPLIAKQIVEAYKKNKATHCIGLCGTGIGISNALSRYDEIKCLVTSTPMIVKEIVKIEKVNTLALGGRMITYDIAIRCVNNFLNIHIN